MLTIASVETALRNAGIDGYFINVDSDGALNAPGIKVYMDEQDPDNTGLAYRSVYSADDFDVETMAWNREDSGAIDDDADVEMLVGLAAACAAKLA